MKSRSYRPIQGKWLLQEGNRPVYDLTHREETVCFTGHRFLSKEGKEPLSALLDRVLEHLYGKGYRCFVCGGALGFDTLAARRVLALRQAHPDARLVLALPCGDQSHAWREKDQQVWEELREAADEVNVLSPTYYEGCMHVRNRYMVNRSSLVLCYLRHARGGTMSTVGYALREQVPVLNLAMEEAVLAYIGEEA